MVATAERRIPAKYPLYHVRFLLMKKPLVRRLERIKPEFGERKSNAKRRSPGSVRKDRWLTDLCSGRLLNRLWLRLLFSPAVLIGRRSLGAFRMDLRYHEKDGEKEIIDACCQR